MIDYDINNHATLKTGADSWRNSPPCWLSMATAPKTGEWIEIKNSYGVAPTYALARWTDQHEVWVIGTKETQVFTNSEGAQWHTRDGSGYISEAPLTWRPYVGDPESYVDPTNGAQNSPAYWRGASAAKHNLPLTYFEEQTSKNTRKRP